MTTYGKLFRYLKQEFAKGDECDNTLRLTKLFAEQHKLSFAELSEVLMGMGGYCDCEVLLNAAFRIPPQDHIGKESFKTPLQVAVEMGLFLQGRFTQRQGQGGRSRVGDPILDSVCER